ncbi:uncharacterized protein LOC133805883 [Humulus lupulus]|uniref:uncharacterized protein LOC133805883 n=1 Tax=Humulus lupulus TaxID=3486 RepID=UPI002B4108B6|nr:uncharacterized protein LOC133805883 [Humulus lupulus]
MGEKLMNYKAVEYGNEMLMGLGGVSQKIGGFDLMQNCDLPPPMKVYMGPEKTIVSPSMKHRFFNPMNMGLNNSLEQGENDNDKSEFDDDNDNVYRKDAVGGNYDKLELLKALRLSQTRAREAEKKIKVLAKEKDSLSKALVDEAKILFAHRQWVRLLELQASTLCCKSKVNNYHHHHQHDHDQDGSCITWVVAFAFCLGIAAIGCTYMF